MGGRLVDGLGGRLINGVRLIKRGGLINGGWTVRGRKVSRKTDSLFLLPSITEPHSNHLCVCVYVCACM